jgi:hypothetical protein
VQLADGDEDAHRILSHGLQHAADRTSQAAHSSSGAPTSEDPAPAERGSTPTASHEPEHQQGQQASVQLQRKDDLVAALDAVLALASDLASGGPWWQQARAQHPLLLIPTLVETCSVSGTQNGRLNSKDCTYLCVLCTMHQNIEREIVGVTAGSCVMCSKLIQ